MVKQENILCSFHFVNYKAFVLSVFPSAKYKITMWILLFSPVFVSFSELIGFKPLTVIAFCILTVAELFTGIYASVIIRNEKLQSSKATRFTIKFASILIILFVLHSFQLQYKGDNGIAESFFEWLYMVAMAWFAMEYLISFLENTSSITNDSNSALIAAIRNKFNKILDLDITAKDNTNEPIN